MQKKKLDLHFCDNLTFTQFNDFQATEDLSSNHKIMIITMNLGKGKILKLKSKNQLQKVQSDSLSRLSSISRHKLAEASKKLNENKFSI